MVKKRPSSSTGVCSKENANDGMLLYMYNMNNCFIFLLIRIFCNNKFTAPSKQYKRISEKPPPDIDPPPTDILSNY